MCVCGTGCPKAPAVSRTWGWPGPTGSGQRRTGGHSPFPGLLLSPKPLTAGARVLPLDALPLALPTLLMGTEDLAGMVQLQT